MMRWASAVHVLLGGALLVPAIGAGQSPRDLKSAHGANARDLTAAHGANARDLTAALSGTERAIQMLASIDADLRGGDSTAIERLLRATEAPFAPPRETDDALERLRRDVAHLLERADARAFDRGPFTETRRDATELTTGLDAALRDAIETRSARGRYEPKGYNADPLRAGIALVLANEPARASRILEPLAGDPRAAYWRGRALEAQGELDAALLEYERAASDPRGGDVAERARFDGAVCSWKAGRAGGVAR